MGALSTAAPGFWIKADAITGLSDGAAVTSVTDQSDNGLTATSGGGTVVYKTAISPTGLPVMRFVSGDGDDWLVSAASTSASAQSIVAVVRSTTTAATQASIRSASNPGGLQFRRNGSAYDLVDQSVVAIGTSNSVVSTTAFQVVIITFDSSTGAYAFYVDGVAQGSGTHTGVTFTASLTTGIGKKLNDAATEPFDGDIGELASWSRVLTGTEITNISSELTTKWNTVTTGGTVAAISGVSGSTTARLAATGTVAGVSAVSGATTALLPATGTVAGVSGVTGSATVIPATMSGTVAAVSGVYGSATLLRAPVFTFTPPTTTESSEDILFGRYKIPVGLSVLWNGSTFVTQPFPWLGELVNLTEGVTWFQGGRTYTITPTVAASLTAAGYTTGT